MRTALFGLVLMSSLTAAAQTSAPPQTSTESVQQPMQPAPVVEQEIVDVTRVRWGIGSRIGAFFPQFNINVGIDGRVGVQINRIFSVFGSFGTWGGIGFSGSLSPTGQVQAGINGAGILYAGVMGEATLGDLFNLGLGMVIGPGGWGGVGGSGAASSTGAGATVTAVAAGGWVPTVDARIGFGFGKRTKGGRRGGFSIALDCQILIAPDSVYTRTTASSNGMAGATVTTRGAAVGVAPALLIGYDAR